MIGTSGAAQKSLRVLILEDQESDAMLMAHELRRSGYLVAWKRVETERDFIAELDQGAYDVVLSDYSLPSFNAFEALARFRERKLDIPFIVVTGSLGEEQAVNLMKHGASDYLIKDRLARLGGAVATALEQKRLRDDNRTALYRLRQSEERFRRLAENAPDIIYRFRLTPDQVMEYISPAVERMTGYRPVDFYNDPQLAKTVIHPDDFAMILTQAARSLYLPGPAVIRLVRKDGSMVWIEIRNTPVTDPQGNLTAMEGAGRDVTERIQREREQEAVISVAASLRDALTRSDIYPVVLKICADLLKVDGSAISTFSTDNPEIQVETGYGAWAAWQGMRLVMGEEAFRQVAVRGKPYVQVEVQRELQDVPLPWSASLQWLNCVPLRSQGEVLGILWVAQPGEASTHEAAIDPERLLVAIADIASGALHRARLYEETQQRVQHLTALRTIDRAITASLDLHLMLDVLVDQLMIQNEVDGVELLLLDPYTHQLNPTRGRGFKGRGLESVSLRMGESLAGRVVLSRRVLSIPDFQTFLEAWPQKAFYTSEGFHSYLGVPLIAQGEVLGVLEILRRSTRPFTLDWLEFVESLVGQVAIAINNAKLFDKLQRTTYDIIQAYDATIEGWSRALEMREIETRGHTNRVVWLTTRLARALHVPDSDMVHIRRGALLHDVGMMAMPDNILLKPGPLSAEEQATMHNHPTYAFEWLSPILYLQPALDIPYAHHEAWDGSGYPRGLKAGQIPLSARIFSVVDVWDALRSDRPFRAAWPEDQALQYLKNMAGTQFDPDIVSAFADVIASEGEDF